MTMGKESTSGEKRTSAVSAGSTRQTSLGGITDTVASADASCQTGVDEALNSTQKKGHATASPETEVKDVNLAIPSNEFSLPRDAISEILLFSDFESAVKLSHLTCRDPSHFFPWVWKEMFDRQGFAPSANNQEKPNHSNFLEETKYRRRLLRNLTSPVSHNKRRSSNIFALPHSCFRFVPISPDEVENNREEDPPLVNFDSFLLTTPTQEEYLSFNPYTGKLVVYPSILTHALPSRDLAKCTDKEHQIRIEADQRKRRPTVLHDNGSLSLREYGFSPTPDNVDLEIEIVNLGLECKHSEAGRTMVALGRQLVHANLMMQQQEDETSFVVTEVKSWERQQVQGSSFDGGDQFGSARICRFRHGFHTMELDQLNQQLLVNPENEDEEGNEGPTEVGSTCIHIYPLVSCQISDDSGCLKSGDCVDPIARYFPSPITTLNCGEAVTTLACSGKSLLVATSKGKIQLYEQLQRKHTFSVAESVLAASQKQGRRNKQQSEMILRTTAAATAPIDTIRVAPHLSMERHGFVTLQHDDDLGNTLLLWMPCSKANTVNASNGTYTATNRANKRIRSDDREDAPTTLPYQVESVIQLPLLPHRIPKFHYDGRRLIVYGQDHIGFILLVYKVQFPDDDDDDREYHQSTPSNLRQGNVEDGSGAGILFSSSGRLRFAHRIRHAALGGHSEFESIHMTCNERFVVLNTKMGHEIGGGAGRDGLLVIDLEKAD